MGLTIHYSLKTKGSDAQAKQTVASLHRAAADLPFKHLGDLVDLSGDDCDFREQDKDDPLRWLLCRAEANMKLAEEQWISVKPTRILCFSAWPGEGCEQSNFGLCRYPATIAHPDFGTVKTKLSGWCWSSFCKTQYASNPDCGGISNFLRCHLTVVAMLDHAKTLGCLDKASDEGKFWENRDVPALVKEISSWNQMIAAFGGKLKDVLGEGLQSAIAEYPNFEQLEAAGQSQLPPEMESLARLIKQVVKEREAGS